MRRREVQDDVSNINMNSRIKIIIGSAVWIVFAWDCAMAQDSPRGSLLEQARSAAAVDAIRVVSHVSHLSRTLPLDLARYTVYPVDPPYVEDDKIVYNYDIGIRVNSRANVMLVQGRECLDGLREEVVGMLGKENGIFAHRSGISINNVIALKNHRGLVIGFIGLSPLELMVHESSYTHGRSEDVGLFVVDGLMHASGHRVTGAVDLDREFASQIFSQEPMMIPGGGFVDRLGFDCENEICRVGTPLSVEEIVLNRDRLTRQMRVVYRNLINPRGPIAVSERDVMSDYCI